jgi:hypothetical protein
MALTIFDSTQEWGGDDRGLQLFGTCRRTKGRGVLGAERVYGKRFRTFAKLMKGRSDAERRQAAQLQSYAFFRFIPTTVKILDEPEFGGGTFVVATIRRSPREKDPRRRAVVRWQATHLYVPSRKVGEFRKR